MTDARRGPNRNRAAVHIGTSGWHYRHWVGPFYPTGSRPGDYLVHYEQHFTAAEINGSFYRMPSAKTLVSWRDATPPAFRFAVKAHRFITHMKKLSLPISLYDWFLQDIALLEPKLGPVLFQLPPAWKANPDRLAAFLAALPSRYRYAIELRNQTWMTEPIFDLLRSHRVAFCIHDIGGYQSPFQVTADFVYVRLHGPGAKYQGCYDDVALGTWARRIDTWRREGLEVWCFFDNDQNGYAAKNALCLRRMMPALLEA